jgi:L,D-transpeptidase YcbB
MCAPPSRDLPGFLGRLGLLVLTAGALAAPLRAQELDELIRVRVEELRAAGELEAHGVAIASRNLIPALYEARGFAPEWRAAAQIDGLLEAIDESYLEGLDPTDYHVDAVRAARAAFANLDALAPEERAAFDLVLSDSVIRLGYHLRFGKVDPVELDPSWNFSRQLNGRDPVATIQAAIDAPSMREFAAHVIPRGFLYQRLKSALARYRALAAAGGWPEVPAGPTLKAGMRDPRVSALAARLAATGDLAAEAPPADDTLYIEPLVAAVRRFQERHGLAGDGVVGPATRVAPHVPIGARIEQIRANLERARWVFNELDNDFIGVNIAAYRLDLVRGGDTVWSTRVVVGQPYRKTPVFKATMRYVVFNPTWTVPPTIVAEDVLPDLRRKGDYIATHHLEIFDVDGARIDPAAVDWSSRRNFPYRFVQQPGPSNALGRVKFMFPNDHFIYLHDTPSRDLFTRQSRAFSSGCIRVEHPLDLAALLLGPKWNPARIESVIATERTETVFLDAPITVMLLYSTTEVDEDGRVVFWPDIYERDPAVIAGLNAPFRAGAAL